MNAHRYTRTLGALLTGLALSTASVAQADALDTWATSGDASVQTGTVLGLNLGSSATLVLGTASTDYADDAPAAAGAYNVSGHSALDTDTLQSTLGLSAGALDDNALLRYAYEGSLASQTFSVQAGDTISFDWRLLSQASGGAIDVPDTAWLLWQQNGSTTLIKLADTSSLSTVSAGWLDSGLLHGSYTAANAGNVTLSFVLADINSYDTTSLLAVQNVALTTAVPEPESLALCLMGLGILGLRARRSNQA
jgi:hypothetical protein